MQLAASYGANLNAGNTIHCNTGRIRILAAIYPSVAIGRLCLHKLTGGDFQRITLGQRTLGQLRGCIHLSRKSLDYTHTSTLCGGLKIRIGRLYNGGQSLINRIDVYQQGAQAISSRSNGFIRIINSNRGTLSYLGRSEQQLNRFALYSFKLSNHVFSPFSLNLF